MPDPAVEAAKARSASLGGAWGVIVGDVMSLKEGNLRIFGVVRCCVVSVSRIKDIVKRISIPDLDKYLKFRAPKPQERQKVPQTSDPP